MALVQSMGEDKVVMVLRWIIKQAVVLCTVVLVVALVVTLLLARLLVGMQEVLVGREDQ
jgi:flagellar biosynthesis protein FliQ